MYGANMVISQSHHPFLPPISIDLPTQLHLPNHLRCVRQLPKQYTRDATKPSQAEPTNERLPHNPDPPLARTINHTSRPARENHLVRAAENHLRKLRKYRACLASVFPSSSYDGDTVSLAEY